MTHETAPRPSGRAAGPEHDHALPDARTVPVHRTAADALAAEQEGTG